LPFVQLAAELWISMSSMRMETHRRKGQPTRLKTYGHTGLGRDSGCIFLQVEEELKSGRDNGADWPQESPDGKWLYYGKGRSRRRPGHLRTTLKADLSLSSRTRSLW
jgi:hypothetical protein